MKILKAEIQLYKDFDNAPNIKILVDKIPSHNMMIYNQKEYIYYAQCGGYVSYYSYTGPDEGYGGRTFELNMADGSVKKLKGPWHCGSRIANKYFDECVECTITEDPIAWKNGFTFYSGAITLKKFKLACKMAQCGIGKSNDYYIPIPKCESCGDKHSNKVRLPKERLYLCEKCEISLGGIRRSYEITK